MDKFSAPSASGGKVWIPVDVKTRWFSFLPAPDLARCARACRSWSSLAVKTCDAQFAVTVGATPPNLSRAGKLRFLHRLHNAHAPENMGYLLAWAAGCRGEDGQQTGGKRGVLPAALLFALCAPPPPPCPCRVHALPA
jgi:hypothetical protein